MFGNTFSQKSLYSIFYLPYMRRVSQILDISFSPQYYLPVDNCSIAILRFVSLVSKPSSCWSFQTLRYPDMASSYSILNQLSRLRFESGFIRQTLYNLALVQLVLSKLALNVLSIALSQYSLADCILPLLIQQTPSKLQTSTNSLVYCVDLCSKRDQLISKHLKDFSQLLLIEYVLPNYRFTRATVSSVDFSNQQLSSDKLKASMALRYNVSF